MLAIVALLELVVGGYVYTNRYALLDGLDRGINESLIAYSDDGSKAFHIDFVQSNVIIL